MDCGECVYSMDLPDPPALAMRTTARQKTPYYFPADSDEIPANIRKRLTDSAAVLIDAGEASAGDTVLSALQEHGVRTLDYVIATHPHADHIGGMPAVL